MPFTISHAAAAIPFRRSQLVLSAVVAGSFGPDIEYFLRLRAGGGFGHTPAGVLLQSLPLALLGLWAYHSLVKVPLVALCPDPLQQRLQRHLDPFPFRGIRRFARIVLSLLVGIVTHLVLDSFTHEHTWISRDFPGLQRNSSWPPFPGHLVSPTYIDVLQYATSILGLLILGGAFLHWYSNCPQKARHARLFTPAQMRLLWLFLPVIAAICAINRMSIASISIFHHSDLEGGIVTFLAALWWELIIVGISFKVLSGQRSEVTSVNLTFPSREI